MSINNSHYGPNGVLLYNGERILIYYDRVELGIEPIDTRCEIMRNKKSGRIYLTTHRIIFVNKKQGEPFQSFSMPFHHLRNLDVEQPVFGANYIKGEVKSEPLGKWEGTAKFKLWFNNGGAIDFSQCLLAAGKMANQVRSNYASNSTYHQTTSNTNIYPAPPPAYQAPDSNQYNWVPTNTFPDRPQGADVFMYEQPPPYSGVYSDDKTYKFDQSNRVSTGYVDPKSPNKVYMSNDQESVSLFELSQFVGLI
jgi:WW domain-binding protein 2